MKVHNKIGSKERLFEMFKNVNKLDVINENKKEKKIIKEGYSEFGHKIKKSRINEVIDYDGHDFERSAPGPIEWTPEEVEAAKEMYRKDGIEVDVSNPEEYDSMMADYESSLGEAIDLSDPENFNPRDIGSRNKKSRQFEKPTQGSEHIIPGYNDPQLDSKIKGYDDFNPDDEMGESFDNRGIDDYKKYDRIKDSEGNEFSIQDINDTGVYLRGQAGDKEISRDDLKFYEKQPSLNSQYFDQNESFDNPKAKDEKYLDKAHDNVQPNKYDDGTRYPVEKPLKVGDPSLEKMKGDDAPITEMGVEEPMNIEPKIDDVDIPVEPEIPTEEMDSDIPLPGAGEEEAVEGGLADGAEPQEFDSQQIIKGMEVEMEHTDDPKVALEIAMDHLTEIPDYYDHLEDMEAQAQGAEGGEEVAPEMGMEASPMDGMDGMNAMDGMDAMGDGQEGEAAEEITGDGEPTEKEVLWGRMDTVGENDEKKQSINVKSDEKYNKIKGGVGDNATPNEFDKEQISKGINVEMEHTDDPKIALEITLDHLTEDPQYYGTGEEDPDIEAMNSARKDVENDDGEDEVLWGKIDTFTDEPDEIDDYEPKSLELGEEFENEEEFIPQGMNKKKVVKIVV